MADATSTDPLGTLTAPAPLAGQPQPLAGTIPAPQPMPGASGGAVNPVRQQVVSFWQNQGVPPQVAQGIADRAGVESGYDPSKLGDSGTSGGLYQHHDDRLEKLKSFASSQGKAWTDPAVQNAFALTEIKGGDPVATAHWQEILKAPDRATASALWTKYFERPAVPGYSTADMAAQIQKIQQGKFEEADKLSKVAADLAKQIGGEQGNISESMERVRRAQDRADEANNAALKAISKAPSQPDIDGVNHLNGLATFVGIIGGLFTRSPMRASLNAAASAIEAYNDHDREAYNTAYKNWTTQTDLLFKIADMTQTRVKDILYDEQMGNNERRALLDSTLRAAGLTQLADQTKIEGYSAPLDWMEKMQAAQTAHDDRRVQQDQAHEYRMALLGQNKTEAQEADAWVQSKASEVYEQTGQWPTADQRLQLLGDYEKAKHAGAGGSGLAAEKQAAVEQSIKEWREDPKNAQWVADHPNERLPADVFNKLVEPSARGAQAATQIQALIGASNELIPALKNLVDLDVGATSGIFMGVQTGRPESLSEAVKRSLANKITSDQASAVLSRFAGVSRSLAIIEGQGRATGLVGLQKMNEAALVPQEFDTPLKIMSKYAEMRQIIEQNVETMKASPYVGAAQKELLDKIGKEAKEAVPWTVSDLNVLLKGKGSTESTRDFAERVLQKQNGGAPAEAVAELKEHRDDPVYRDSFKKHFPNADIDKLLTTP
jgi:Phage tail lysozyme